MLGVDKSELKARSKFVPIGDGIKPIVDDCHIAEHLKFLLSFQTPDMIDDSNICMHRVRM